MTISAEDWDKYIKRLSRIQRKAAEEMRAQIEKVGYEDVRALVDFAYGLTSYYGEMSAALSAEMYDAIALLEEAYTAPAEMAATASYGEVAKAVYGTAKHRNGELMAGAVERMVKMASADTMVTNAIRDRKEMAWIPRGDTCAFCIMLASRGWERASDKALSGGHAEHIHAHCDCTFAVRSGRSLEYAGYDPDKYLDMYYDADGMTWQERVNSMRRDAYAANRKKILAQKKAAREISQELESSEAEEIKA